MTAPTLPPRRNFEIGFFDEPSTRQAVERIAASQRVTIFVGAGAAADQGLPSWSGLVNRLLAGKLQQTHGQLDPDKLAKVAGSIVSQYYQIPTATILDQLYRDDAGGDEARALAKRNDDLRHNLYQVARDWSPVDPTVIEEILFLAFTLKAAGVSVHIVTTNYDDLFETCAERGGSRLDLLDDWQLETRAYYDAPPTAEDESDGVVPIVHVHGHLPRAGGGSRDVVFSEGDYINWEDSSPFRTYLTHAFAKGVVLMVGTSLRDNNIAAKLRLNRQPDCVRYALLPSEGEVRSIVGHGRDLAHTVVNYACVRGQQLGVHVLRPDFYGQVVQFLREVAIEVARTKSGPPQDYGSRMRAWAGSWQIQRYSDADALAGANDDLGELASWCKSQIPSSAVSAAKIELWVRTNPDERTLELWADSRSIRNIGRNHYDRHLVRLDAASDHAAVRCFASRTVLDGRFDGHSNRRWSHFVAAPIQQANEVPVGVVVLALAAHPKRQADSYLATVRRKRDALVERMLTTCTPLLSPEPYDPPDTNQDDPPSDTSASATEGKHNA